MSSPTDAPEPARTPDPPITPSPLSRLRTVAKVLEVRLRFVALLVVIGLALGYRETLAAHWRRFTRRAPAGPSALPEGSELYCPMHPSVVRNALEPDGTVPRCPLCGMPLAERRHGEVPVLPPGVTARLQLTPERIHLAGIRTEAVAFRRLAKEIRTVGTVELDESGLSRIVARTSGYLEALFLSSTFVPVNRGEPLAEISSPELNSAAQDFLLAVRNGPPELVSAARERLTLLGLAPQEIAAVESSGRASARLLIRAPRSGHVIQRSVVQGARVETGATLFEVADLGRVWVEADVLERDLPFVREGLAVRVTLDALPGRTLEGKIALVHPHVQGATRTNQVRVVLANEQHELRPGMFASVEIAVPLADLDAFRPRDRSAPAGHVLAVPERAVIDTGTRRVVYVERRGGIFEGRRVTLGPRIGEHYPVLSGVAPDERVAAAGAFLIDAETRLNPQPGAEAEPAPAPTAPTAVELSPEARANLDALPPADRAMALAQRECPSSGEPLGGMGVPLKVIIRGEAVFFCCKACLSDATSDPAGTLEKARALRARAPK